MSKVLEDLIKEMGHWDGSLCWPDYVDRMERAFTRGFGLALKQRDEAYALVDDLEKLLVCYRIGKRPSESLLDHISKARDLRKTAEFSKYINEIVYNNFGPEKFPGEFNRERAAVETGFKLSLEDGPLRDAISQMIAEKIDIAIKTRIEKGEFERLVLDER